ncbi:hypothetical protein LshimejAT787_1204620 [Lyophyllum shimeji]|uniref:Uncharacterized protein n=1 Tax=Lyophyllum shimeji TaxID=47721 RepID=A0A9P3URU5_LYOSH|nr:hypothetical protein LshimejAT787_1204620 [Lyophyllum shimeji]
MGCQSATANEPERGFFPTRSRGSAQDEWAVRGLSRSPLIAEIIPLCCKAGSQEGIFRAVTVGPVLVRDKPLPEQPSPVVAHSHAVLSVRKHRHE